MMEKNDRILIEPCYLRLRQASTPCTHAVTSDQWHWGFVSKNLLTDGVCLKPSRCQTKFCRANKRLAWYPDKSPWKESPRKKSPLKKSPPKKSLWIPLSANLFRLESSILTRVKWATNRNNVATEKRRYNFFFGGILVGGILSGNRLAYTLRALKRIVFVHLSGKRVGGNHHITILSLNKQI